MEAVKLELEVGDFGAARARVREATTTASKQGQHAAAVVFALTESQVLIGNAQLKEGTHAVQHARELLAAIDPSVPATCAAVGGDGDAAAKPGAVLKPGGGAAEAVDAHVLGRLRIHLLLLEMMLAMARDDRKLATGTLMPALQKAMQQAPPAEGKDASEVYSWCAPGLIFSLAYLLAADGQRASGQFELALGDTRSGIKETRRHAKRLRSVLDLDAVKEDRRRSELASLQSLKLMHKENEAYMLLTKGKLVEAGAQLAEMVEAMDDGGARLGHFLPSIYMLQAHLRLASAGTDALAIRTATQTGIELMERAVAAARLPDTRTKARIHLASFLIHAVVTDAAAGAADGKVAAASLSPAARAARIAQIQEQLEAIDAAAEAQGAPGLVTCAKFLRGYLLYVEGQYMDVKTTFNDLMRAQASPAQLTSNILTLLGRLYASTGDAAKGLQVCTVAYDLAGNTGNLRLQASLMPTLEQLHRRNDDPDQASSFLTSSLEQQSAIGKTVAAAGQSEALGRAIAWTPKAGTDASSTPSAAAARSAYDVDELVDTAKARKRGRRLLS